MRRKEGMRIGESNFQHLCTESKDEREEATRAREKSGVCDIIGGFY